MTSDRIDELIALAALGELSADDRRELDEAARRDSSVSLEVDRAMAAAAALQRANAKEPPATLRSSVLAAIASTPQEPGPDAAAGPEAPGGAEVVSLSSERKRRRVRPALLVAAVAALFFVGGVALVATNGDSSDPIAAVVDAPDAITRALSGEIDGLTVVFSPSEGALVVEGDGVPVLDDEATYQLWLVGDDAPISVGVFRPDADGRVAA
jgi:anti-sigma-K factor RskA